jgi:hypothetical protein
MLRNLLEEAWIRDRNHPVVFGIKAAWILLILFASAKNWTILCLSVVLVHLFTNIAQVHYLLPISEQEWKKRIVTRAFARSLIFTLVLSMELVLSALLWDRGTPYSLWEAVLLHCAVFLLLVHVNLPKHMKKLQADMWEIKDTATDVFAVIVTFMVSGCFTDTESNGEVIGAVICSFIIVVLLIDVVNNLRRLKIGDYPCAEEALTLDEGTR